MKPAVKYPETFWGRVKMSFSLVLKDPLVYLLYPAVFLLVVSWFFAIPVEVLMLRLEDPQFLGSLFEKPMVIGGGIFFLLLALILSIFIFLFTSVALMRYAAQKEKGKTPKFGKLLSDLRFDVKEYFLLGLRFFWYVLWPIVLFILVAFTLLWGLSSAGIIQEVQSDGAMDIVAGYEFLWIVLTLGLSIPGLVLLFLTIYRSFQMMLAFPAFAVDNKNAKDSFETSLKATKGKLISTVAQLFGAEIVWGALVLILATVVYLTFELALPGVIDSSIRVLQNGDEMFIISKPSGALLQAIEVLLGSLAVGGVAVFTALFYTHQAAELKKENKKA